MRNPSIHPRTALLLPKSKRKTVTLKCKLLYSLIFFCSFGVLNDTWDPETDMTFKNDARSGSIGTYAKNDTAYLDFTGKNPCCCIFRFKQWAHNIKINGGEQWLKNMLIIQVLFYLVYMSLNIYNNVNGLNPAETYSIAYEIY